MLLCARVSVCVCGACVCVQFMVGSALMVVPVLAENATVVDAYLPEGDWSALRVCVCGGRGRARVHGHACHRIRVHALTQT